MPQKVAFLFPGQGAQSVGMCRALYEQFEIFRDTIHEIEDLSYQKLWSIILEGPERDLKKTGNCQMALFATSIATLRVVQFEKPKLQARFCAGLSLGEYTALVAAGVLRLHEAVELVQKRAQLMEKACQDHVGKMIAVIGLTYDQVQKIVHEYIPAPGSEDVVALANYNAPQQIVVAGTLKGLQWFEDKARGAGARRMIELDVAGAFHSPLMKDAARDFAPYVETAHLAFSPINVVSNVTAEPIIYSEDFRELMVTQIVSPVLWCKTIQTLDREGVTLYVEMGPGRVLHGLNRKIGTMSKTVSIETVEDIASLT